MRLHRTDDGARGESTLNSAVPVFGTGRAPALARHASIGHLPSSHPSGSHQLLTIKGYETPLTDDDVIQKLNIEELPGFFDLGGDFDIFG